MRLALVSLKRNIVEATLIEVKWRRGQVNVHELAQDMALQMQDSARVLELRFFDTARIDGALQRAYFANVLRFYFERARRYGMIDAKVEPTFLDHLQRLEKSGLEFRSSYEGFIVSLEQQPQKPFVEGDAKITVLTATDFASALSLVASTSLAESLSTERRKSEVSTTGSTSQPSDPEDGTQSTDGASNADARDGGLADAGSQQDADGASIGVGVPLHEGSLETTGGPIASVPAAPPDLVVPLGESGKGQVAWRPSVKGSPHVFIAGIPGQGKSWTVLRIISVLAQQQVPVIVVDFHGQFIDLAKLPSGSTRPTVLDVAQGLPFSPFECSTDRGSSDWKSNCLAISEIFAYVAGLGAMQRDVVYTAVRDAYLANGFDTQEDVAALEYPTLRDVMTRIVTRERTRGVANVSARCRPLLEMDLFGAKNTGIDMLTTIRSGAVFDLHSLYAETLQLAAGAFILRKLYKDMFRWGQADQLRLVLILDEAHRLARDVTLPKIMKEGRKFGIAVIVASQGLADFHSDVVGTAGTKVVFRTNYPDSRRIAGFIRARSGEDLVARIEGLVVGSAYVQTPEMSYGDIVRMYPLEQGE